MGKVGKVGKVHRQSSYDVRFDWGLEGAAAVADGADVAVIVDVLSFTTTLSVAADVGTVVLPYRWNDARAHDYAQQHDAVLAVGRSQAGSGQFSLSPMTLRSAPAPPRLVLPSPNGSSIAYWLGTRAAACVGASLRNAAAVVAWIRLQYRPGATVAVIAAGERWPGGGLRPAIEDLWGAGAVIRGLSGGGWTALSPEAKLARAGYEDMSGHDRRALMSCVSGQELINKGYRADVEIAAEVDLSDAVPLLQGQRFVRVSSP